MNDGETNLIVVAIIMFFCWLIWKAIHPPDGEDDAEVENDNEDDFEYLTVREQLAAAQETSYAIGELEQLITDMQESTEDDLMILHIEWVGRDNSAHAIDLFCDGVNTASECMIEIGDREAHDLRATLAYQCSVLSSGTRSRKNSRKNDSRFIGEDEIAETVSTMRNDYLY